MKTHLFALTCIYILTKSKGLNFTGTIMSKYFTFATHPATIYTYSTDISNCFHASSPLLDTMGITEKGVSWQHFQFPAGSSSICDIYFDTKPKLGLWKQVMHKKKHFCATRLLLQVTVNPWEMEVSPAAPNWVEYLLRNHKHYLSRYFRCASC